MRKLPSLYSILGIVFINSFLIIFYRFYPLQLSGHDIEWLWPFSQSWHWFEKPFTQMFFHFLLPFFKLNSTYYYMVGFFLHTFNALLIFYLIKLIINNKSVAFIASLIFSVHYINTAVNLTIVHTAEKLSLLLFLACFICLIKFFDSKKKKFYFLSLILFIFGIGSKESIYSLPLVILFYVLIYRKNNFIKFLYPFFAIVLAHLLTILLVFPTTSGYLSDIRGTLVNIKWLTVKFNIVLQMLFIPFDFQGGTLLFSLIYNHSIVLSLITVTILFYLLRYINHKDLKFTLIFLSLSILPFLFARPDLIMEKYLYLPLFPASLLISFLIWHGIKSTKLKIIVTTLLAISLFSSSYFRYIDYSFSTDLASSILRQEKNILLKYPKDSAVYHINFPDYIRRVGVFADASIRNLDYFYLKNRNFKERRNIEIKRLDYFKIVKEFYCDNGVFLFYNNKKVIDITPFMKQE